MEIAAEMTNENWADLEQFAAKRLRRSATSPARQRALTQCCGRSLVHTALERFGLGDMGDPRGRRLRPEQRTITGLVHALQSAINSLVSDACRRAETEHEHLHFGNPETDPGACEPSGSSDPVTEAACQDLTHQLFSALEAGSADAQYLAAVAALKEDCVTGNARGNGGVDKEVKRRVRQRARQICGELLEH